MQSGCNQIPFVCHAAWFMQLLTQISTRNLQPTRINLHRSSARPRIIHNWSLNSPSRLEQLVACSSICKLKCSHECQLMSRRAFILRVMQILLGNQFVQEPLLRCFYCSLYVEKMYAIKKINLNEKKSFTGEPSSEYSLIPPLSFGKTNRARLERIADWWN